MNREQERLVEENMGLVGHMIARVFGKSPRLGCMDYDDLFQVGSIGLCKAAESYKADGRAKFSTYACVVIRNEFYKAIEKESRPEMVPIDENMPAPARKESGFLIERLEKAMERMSPAEKRNLRALILFAWGYSCKEIGGMFKVSDRHASMLISRVRKSLLETESFCDPSNIA